MLALDEWCTILLGMTEEFQVFTNHQSLGYFKKTQRLNPQQARWLMKLRQYHFTLHHQAGALNQTADLLLRRADHNQGKVDNKDVILLKTEMFRRQEFEIQSIDLH